MGATGWRGLLPQAPKNQNGVYTEEKMNRWRRHDNVDLVDRETGETMNPETHMGYTKEGYDKRNPEEFKEGEEFMKVFNGAMHDLGRRLTPRELTFLVMILEYVSYNDCVIRMGGRKNGEVMGLVEMAEATGMEYTRVTRIVVQLERKGVMGHHVTGSILKGYEGKARKVYTINPNIFCRGKYVNGVVAEFYSSSGWGGTEDKRKRTVEKRLKRIWE